jgi:hypothetical protein
MAVTLPVFWSNGNMPAYIFNPYDSSGRKVIDMTKMSVTIDDPTLVTCTSFSQKEIVLKTGDKEGETQVYVKYAAAQYRIDLMVSDQEPDQIVVDCFHGR